MPVYLSGTETLSRTINLPQAGDYTAIWWVRPRSVPTGGNYICFFTLKNVAYTQYAGFFTQSGSLQTNLEVNNNDGSGQHDTPQVLLAVNTWYTLAYVRSGTTHQCWINGVLGGSVTVDTSAVVWSDLLIGYDGFSVSDFDTWGFREYASALSGFALFSQMQRAVPNGVVQTDTPLLTDLLDRTANNNDFTGPAIPTFEAGPVDRLPATRPTQLLTGTWVRFSNILLQIPTSLRLLEVQSGTTLSLNGGLSTGGRTIARVSIVGDSFSAGGPPGNQVYLTSTFHLLVEYLSASSFLLVSGGTFVDPWIDPLVGTSATTPTVRFIDLTPHRVAVAIKASSFSGGVYANDGELRVYVDDVVVISLTGLHFADIHPFSPTASRTVGFGCEQCIDHVWTRFGPGVPVTDADGVVLDTTNLWYQDSFDNGNLVAWGPFQSKTIINALYPHAISDVGGGGGYGLSDANAPGTAIAELSGPYLNGSGVSRLFWDDVAPTPPIPPTPPPAACPVSLLPTAVAPPAACPVNLVP